MCFSYSKGCQKKNARFIYPISISTCNRRTIVEHFVAFSSQLSLSRSRSVTLTFQHNSSLSLRTSFTPRVESRKEKRRNEPVRTLVSKHLKHRPRKLYFTFAFASSFETSRLPKIPSKSIEDEIRNRVALDTRTTKFQTRRSSMKENICDTHKWGNKLLFNEIIITTTFVEYLTFRASNIYGVSNVRMFRNGKIKFKFRSLQQFQRRRMFITKFITNFRFFVLSLQSKL